MSEEIKTPDSAEDLEKVSIPPFVHFLFFGLYLLLALRLVLILFVEDRQSGLMRVVDRYFRLLHEPLMTSPDFDGHRPTAIAHVIFAVICYGIVHFAIWKAIPVNPAAVVMNTVLNFFRLIFYITAILFLAVMIVRMAVMTYQDIQGPKIVPVRISETLPVAAHRAELLTML